tara:strand:+ start:1021 stop:1821 length:801 start_codon:yes stop_codon:yes gene_type:complete
MITSPKKIAIYRCVFGDYDIVLDERVVIPEANYYLFTDDPSLEVYPYRKILITKVNDSPSLTNRSLKLVIPDRLVSYDMTIYLDGNIGVFSSLRKLINEFLASKADIGLFTHPNHSSLEGEIELCILNNKSLEKELRAELAFYSQSAYPKVEKFSDNSILFRKKPTKNTCEALIEWLALVKKFSGRDQLSLPFIRSKYSLNEHFFDFSPRTRGNQYFIVFPHKIKSSSIWTLNLFKFRLIFKLKKILLFYLFIKNSVHDKYHGRLQ